MQGKHWIIVGAMLGAVALQIGSLDYWGDAVKPQFIAGVLLALSTTITAMFTDKPSNGNGKVSPATVAKIAPAILLAIGLAFGAAACTPPPPTLSPAAQHAFQNTRVIRGLDLLRDTAIQANAQQPPLLSEATTRKVVTYHRSALLIIHAADTGWKPAVLQGLQELGRDLPPKEAALLAPYLALLNTILSEVLV